MALELKLFDLFFKIYSSYFSYSCAKTFLIENPIQWSRHHSQLPPLFPASVLFFLIFYTIPDGQYTKIKLLIFLLLLVKINIAILVRVIKEVTTIQQVKDNQSEQIRQDEHFPLPMNHTILSTQLFPEECQILVTNELHNGIAHY